MFIMFIGLVEKYPQAVITHETHVEFCITSDCEFLEINVFSILDLFSWDVGVYFPEHRTKIRDIKKFFNEKTRGWNLKIVLEHTPKESKRIIVFANKPRENELS